MILALVTILISAGSIALIFRAVLCWPAFNNGGTS